MQLAPHVIRGEAHADVDMHVAPMQNCDALHAFPHEPQFAWSVCTSTHAPAQVIRGDGHVTVGVVHAPSMQNCPDVQA